MDNKIMIMSKKQRLQDNNRGIDRTGGQEVAGSSPVAPICRAKPEK